MVNTEKKNIKEYFSSKDLDKCIRKLAIRINQDYKGQHLIIIGLLKGCLFFLTDLVRKLTIDINIEIIYAVSYQGVKTTGNVEILLDLRKDIFQRSVLLLDDIVDSGLTLNRIREMLLAKEPSSLEVGVLFDKKECRIQPIDIKYTGYIVPNKFFVGYGMDYNGLYRELPYLGVLEEGT